MIKNYKNFNRNEIELQEYFIFCASYTSGDEAVHGMKVGNFLRESWFNIMTPFEYIKYLLDENLLPAMICHHRLGDYRRLAEVFEQCLSINLNNITLEELESTPGIGPRIAREFILNTRPDQQCVILESQILSWLQTNTMGTTIPSATPESSTRYKTLENLYLQHRPQSIKGDALVS